MKNDRVSVAYLIRSLEMGGAEVQMTGLAAGLSKDLFDVTVLCFYAKGPLLRQLENAGIRVISLNKKNRWDLFGFFLRLIRELRALEPDIVHSFLGPPGIMAILAKPFVFGATIVWGVRSSNMDLSHFDITWRVSFALEKLLSSFPNLIIANSHAGREYICAKGFSSRNLRVVPNGINTDIFCYDDASRTRIRAEWGIADNVCLIGLVGRLDPMKDHATFLQSAARLIESGQNVCFVCIGGDGLADKGKLLALSEELELGDQIIWAGHRADLPSVLNALDIHCSTSISEGFSNAIAESMAVGIPSVATDVGDSARIVSEYGNIVSPGSPDSTASACMELIDLGRKRRQKLGRLCSAHIKNNYSRQTMIQKMTEIYCSQANDH
jgi:glycosyltransferase involved in cell wall biosynthesis